MFLVEESWFRLIFRSSLFICFVFADTLDAFTQRLISLFELMVELDEERPRPCFWFPSGFSNIRRKALSRRRVDEAIVARALGSSPDLTTTVEEETANDPDSDDEDDVQYVSSSRMSSFLCEFGSSVNAFCSRERPRRTPTYF